MERADLELFERSLRHVTEQHTGPALDTALDELGWTEALLDDPRAAISLLFGLQGASNATSSALERVVGGALGLDAAPTDAFVLPAIGRWDPPGTLDGARLAVNGIGRAALADRAHALVMTAQGDDTVTAVGVPTSSLELRPIDGVDPALGLVEVRGQDLADAEVPEAPAQGWTDAVALARLALAHELVGASRTMLELAREHALARIQFDVPISSFQAVRHRLAETLVAIETAEAVIDAAWLDGSPATAAMAKAVAGREARTAARHCQQVLAGIGFTTEHSFHLYFRRVLVLDALFGTSRTLTRSLGDDLLATRQLPSLLPL
jgi:Acyl-CoA dehydrogenase, C-terminal domain